MNSLNIRGAPDLAAVIMEHCLQLQHLKYVGFLSSSLTAMTSSLLWYQPGLRRLHFCAWFPTFLSRAPVPSINPDIIGPILDSCPGLEWLILEACQGPDAPRNHVTASMKLVRTLALGSILDLVLTLRRNIILTTLIVHFWNTRTSNDLPLPLARVKLNFFETRSSVLRPTICLRHESSSSRIRTSLTTGTNVFL
jgi:hypothetical protein